MSSEPDDDFDLLSSASPAPLGPSFDVDDDDEDGDPFDALGLVQEGANNDLSKPWMKLHKFHLVKAVKDVRELVDACLAHGSCSLDLETEGFDNRIEYDARGNPHTRHKIVGYCLGLKGEGYYIPVRHRWEKLYDPRGPNVDDVVGTEQEIKRLCLASQPVVDPEAAKYDPLGAKELAEPPKVVIKFWHAKFDQEFLYPVTGIDWWHPESFEDGMLASYTIYTDDNHDLKGSALDPDKLPPIKDPKTKEEYRYEMIRYKDLFPRGTKKQDQKFYMLSPSAEGEGWNCVLYGCSDGICTELICDHIVPKANDKKYKGIYRLEKQVAQAVRIIERTRVLIDKDEIVNLLREAEEELQQYEDRIVKLAESLGFANFNPSSSQQMSEFLFEAKGLNLNPKPGKTDTGQYKTDEKTLESILENSPSAPEVLTWIIKHRQIRKVKGTYLENLSNNTDENNQIRLNFKQTGAATGRFTAPKGDADHGFAGVPIQGIPGKVDPKKPRVAHSMRRVFVARPGYVIAKVDYASQELRIAASVSGEDKWIREYVKEIETGEPADLHYLTAQAFFPGLKTTDPDFKLKRGAGKTANFALVYGGGVGAVQRATGCDEVEGARLLKAFQASVPKFSAWVQRQHELVKKHKGVRTAFGRFIAIPDANITADQLIAAHKDREEKKRLKEESEGRTYDVKEPPDKSKAWKDSKGIRAACERKSTNFPIQGSGADILKISLVFLIKEFHIRGWLRNGGDDSVRLIMTVHDEIVFEIREDRVAEAIPILKKIMEYPSTLARWKVPLIAEPELGESWNAKIDWHGVVNGKVPPPPYLSGKEIDVDPFIYVLSKPKAGPSSTPPNGSPPAKETRVLTPMDSKPEEGLPQEEASEPADPAPESTPPPSTPVVHRQYAVFELGPHITDRTLVAIAKAWKVANIDAEADGKSHEKMPIQFQDVYGEVLFSYKENRLCHPEELSRRLRDASFPAVYEVRDVF